MSNKKKQTGASSRPKVGAPDIVLLSLPALVILGLRTFAGPCAHDDGTVSACATTGNVLLGMGVGALVLAFVRTLSADLRTKRIFDLLLAVCGLAIAILPGNVLPLCMMATMRCQAVMAPFARIMGVALTIGAVACELTVDHDIPTNKKRRR